MSHAEDMAERLKLILDGRSRNAFAKRLGIPESTLRSYFEGVAMNLETAARVAEAAGVSLQWLATGKGEMYGTGGASQGVAAGGLSEGAGFSGEDGGLFGVPRLVVHQGMAATRDSERVIALPVSLIFALGLTLDRAAGFEMAPDLAGEKFSAHCIIVVDTAPTLRIGQAGAWLVLVSGEDLLVRFVTQRADGRFDLVADHSSARAETVDGLDGLTVAGRIVWSGGKL